MGSGTRDYLDKLAEEDFQERVAKNKKWLKFQLKLLSEMDLDSKQFYNFKWVIDNMYAKILPMREIIKLLE